jgi:hypothetical protein
MMGVGGLGFNGFQENVQTLDWVTVQPVLRHLSCGTGCIMKVSGETVTTTIEGI